MRVFLFLFAASVFVFFEQASYAQNVGIGETTPLARLHVSQVDSSVAILQNNQTLDVNVNSALYFKLGTKYTGGIKTTGENLFDSRLGFFTYSTTNGNNLVERLSILDNGNVGINTQIPSAQLHVNGSLKITNGTEGNNKVLVSDAAGTATWRASGVNTAFKASNSTTQTVLATSTVQVSFNTPEYNDAASFSANQFTAPDAGIYHFDVMITWDLSGGLASNSSFALRIKKGGNYIHDVWAALPTGTTGNYSQVFSGDFKLLAGDIITIDAYNGSSTSKNLFRDIGQTKYVMFGGHKLY
ncbi:hypothetical protein BH09BAC2_BH09BAC2_09020 [soil metagenome]